MWLDMQTVLVAAALLALVMGLFAVREGLAHPSARHLVVWGVVNLLASASGALLLLDHPHPLVPLLASALSIAGAGLCRSVARICNGGRLDLAFPMALVGVWVVVCVFFWVYPPDIGFLWLSRVIRGFALLAAAWEFHRGRTVRLDSRLTATCLFAAHGAVVIARAGVMEIIPPGLRDIVQPHYLNIFGVEGMAFIALGSFVLMALAKERIAHQATADVRAAHAEAEAARRFLDNLLAGLPSVVYRGTFDADGAFRRFYLSDNAERLFGCREGSDTRGVTFRSLIHPADVAKLDAKRTSVQVTGTGMADYRVQRPDGSWIWVRDQMRIAGTLPNGQPDVIGHLSDVTAEREAAANAISAAKMATLGEMAGGLAQELDQPVNAMCMAVEQASQMLLQRRDPANRPILQRLERIGDYAARTRDVVAHLRAFVRRETGPPVPVDVAEVVRRALRLMRFSLGQSEITVTVEMADDLPLALAQAMALEQVLVNLLSNARDALLADHLPERRIHVSAAAVPAEGVVRLTVADTGGGLSDDVLPRVFEPFFTTKANAKASGLGLSVSYGIVRSFDGSIAARNGQDGAEFVVTLRQAPLTAATG